MELSAATRNAISHLPEILQAQVERWFGRLAEQGGKHPADDILPHLARVVACSEFAGNTLLRYWSELAHRLQDLDEPVDMDALRRFADSASDAEDSTDSVKTALRRQRNLSLLNVLWRELSGAATVDESMAALSDTADHLLRAATAFAQREMSERFGRVRDVDGKEIPMVILAMGKLGGRELNFSSDIDLIFCYSASGESDGRKRLHAQEYFGRLSRQVVQLIDESTADGFVFRTDTRLRPFGESGPPVVSFAALETYLLRHGRDWERYAYVKARIVGSRPAIEISTELFSELIFPFVYRRYLDYGVFESLREMHAMIAAEVVRKELVDNIKLGPGGIREIEFIVQSLQLLRGGSRNELQNPSLLTVLPLLAGIRGLSDEVAESLALAYRFLRRLENFMQAIGDKQTHELPVDVLDRSRLCLAMGFDNWGALRESLDEHRAVVSRQFEEIAFRGTRDDDDGSLRQRLGDLWKAQATVDEWRQELSAADFSEAQNIADIVVAFGSASATRKLDSKAAERLQQFIPRLLLLAGEKRRPATAVSRSLSVIEKVLRRSAYLALLNENRLAAERLVGLCERSSYISGEIARYPMLLDELLDPRPLTGALGKLQLQSEFAERSKNIDSDDSEARMNSLAQFQRATMFRVAVADFNGELPIMKVSDSLTFLAEAVLEEALATAWRDLVAKHGEPSYVFDGNTKTAGFGIIAYGKLGGLELSYGSDLDIIFLHDSKGSEQTTTGDKPLDNAVFFSRLIRRLVHFLTTHTSSGVLYEIDTRLRPSGRKGLLVTSTDAFERYQAENAWTWEQQALLRARPVAGSAAVGREFDRIRAATLTGRVRIESLRDDVLEMRARMRSELDRSNSTVFDLKQGLGGIGDIEFLVQFLVLQQAREHASVIEFSDNIRQLDALVNCGAVAADTAAELQEIYRKYRLRQHHLVLNDEAPLVDAELFLAERERISRLWDEYFEAET